MGGQIVVPTPGRVLQGPIFSVFVPQLALIQAVTNAVRAQITTVAPHGYLDGYVVRVIVPKTYGMTLYQQAIIAVTGATTFTTDIDTSNIDPFVVPSLYPPVGFTPAQCIPMTGVEDNTA